MAFKTTKQLIEETNTTPVQVMQDLQALNTNGVWPNGEVPKWAQHLANAWHCSPAGGGVTSNAWQYVAEYLYDELQKRNSP